MPGEEDFVGVNRLDVVQNFTIVYSQWYSRANQSKSAKFCTDIAEGVL